MIKYFIASLIITLAITSRAQAAITIPAEYEKNDKLDVEYNT